MRLCQEGGPRVSDPLERAVALFGGKVVRGNISLAGETLKEGLTAAVADLRCLTYSV